MEQNEAKESVDNELLSFGECPEKLTEMIRAAMKKQGLTKEYFTCKPSVWIGKRVDIN